MAGERQYCTFFVDGLFFGIDVLEVQEVLRQQEMTCVPLAPTVVLGLINLRGQIVTAIDLRRRLGLPDRPAGQSPMNVVVRAEHGIVSVLVDEVGEVVAVRESAFEKAPSTMRGVSRDLIEGVYKLQDRLLLILDTRAVLDFENGAVRVKGRVS